MNKAVTTIQQDIGKSVEFRKHLHPYGVLGSIIAECLEKPVSGTITSIESCRIDGQDKSCYIVAEDRSPNNLVVHSPHAYAVLPEDITFVPDSLVERK